MIICILRYDRGVYLNMKHSFSYKQECSAFRQSRSQGGDGYREDRQKVCLCLWGHEPFGSVAGTFFPSFPQHSGCSGEAAAEHGLDGNHVTFKPGTLLDDLSICESRVNVINPLFNISGSLCNLCER